MNLRDRLIARIRQSGPISVAEYMADCLLHPEFGYYTTRDPLGRQGDFITAPEISQMFGELIGLALAQCWLDQGRPSPFTLAELGPGRGTLMADALRATRGVPGFADAARVVLVEASPTLRAIQGETLAGHDPRWADSADALPDAPLFLIANEFFDALPIRQFRREKDGWRERQVGLAGDRLAFGLSGPVNPPVLGSRLADTKPGDTVEICPAAGPVTGAVARRIADHGGVALIVDYGDWRALGDTLQAVRDHQCVPVLETPGQADLTAHVAFEPLAESARACGLAATQMTAQGIFLERLGITARAQALARGKGGTALETVRSGHRRLTHPEEMGNLFKVLGLLPATAPLPPGLDP